MKNILVVLLSLFTAILVGSMFIKPDTNVEESIPVISDINVYAFQIGTFNEYSNARDYAMENDGVVNKNGNYYDVYLSLLSNKSNVNRMMKYLDSKDIDYYIKNINVSGNFKKVLNEYEGAMSNAKSDIAFMRINKQILKGFTDND